MDEHLATELAEAQREITHLRRRLDALEDRRIETALPQTMLLDHSFLKRAFAVLGHYFVASLIIVLPFYMLALVIFLLVGGFS